MHLVKKLFIIILGFNAIRAVAQPTIATFSSDSLTAKKLFDIGVLEAFNGNVGKAYRLCKMSYAYTPSAITASFIGSLVPTENFNNKSYWLEKAIELDTTNEEYQLALYTLLSASNKYNEAINQLEKFLKEVPNAEKAMLALSLSYAQIGEFDKALSLTKTVDSISTSSDNRQMAKRLSGSILANLKALPQRKQFILSQIDPNETNVFKLVENVDRLVEINAFNEAIKILVNNPLNKHNNPVVIHQLATLYNSISDTPNAISQIKRLINVGTDELTLEQKIELITDIIAKDTDNRIESRKKYIPILKELYDNNPNERLIRQLYFSLSARWQTNHNSPVFNTELREALEQTPNDPVLQVVQLNEFLTNGEFESAKKLANEIIASSKGAKLAKLNAYNVLVAIAATNKQYIEAEKLIVQAEPLTMGDLQIEGVANNAFIKDIISENEIVATHYSFKGTLFFELGKHTEGFEAYDKALERNRNLPSVLNDYAYQLAFTGGDLDKAEEYAIKAIELLPDSPQINDTYAYVLFLKKNYILAEIYIRKAIELDSKRATYFDRYAKILQAQGKKKEANDNYRKAQAIEPTTERAELIKQLSEQ